MDRSKSKSQTNSSVRERKITTTLPKHIQELMVGSKNRNDFPRMDFTSVGMYGVADVTDALNQPLKLSPWLQDSHRTPISRDTDTKKTKDFLVRAGRSKTYGDVKAKTNKYAQYEQMIQANQYGKIAFINHQSMRDLLPPWCQDRLRTACRSARFELPLDLAILEKITPLQFLAKYTRLYKEQRRRYSRIFQKHKSKLNEYIEFENLFPALNSMCGAVLGTENFEILCLALFMDKNTMLDETTFIGVCTFTDRLFWTSYLEYLDRNTFGFLGPNRSVLEYVDFDSLKRKLHRVTLSKEMKNLLYSLA